MDFSNLLNALGSKDNYHPDLVLYTNNEITGIKNNSFVNPKNNPYNKEIYSIITDIYKSYRLYIAVKEFYYIFNGEYIKKFSLKLFSVDDISEKNICEIDINFETLFKNTKYERDEWIYELKYNYYINISHNGILICTLHLNHAYSVYPDFVKYKWISGVTFYFNDNESDDIL